MLDVELHGASSYISALAFKAQDSTSRLVLPREPAEQSSFHGPISPCWLGEALFSRNRLIFSIFLPEMMEGNVFFCCHCKSHKAVAGRDEEDEEDEDAEIPIYVLN